MRLKISLDSSAVSSCPGTATASAPPAKLLAVFVVDTNETELTFPLGN